MLKELERFADSKGLTVNIAKSEVVNFNDRHVQPLPRFRYKGADLETKEEFKYLGMWFPEFHLVRRSEKQWAQNLLIASNSVLRKAASFGFRTRIDLVLRLFQTYALPLALYGSQVWATSLLVPSKLLNNDLQRRHSSFLKVVTGTRSGTPTRAILAELGQHPLQYHWLKGVLTFWHDSLGGRSPLLHGALHSDIKLSVQDGCTDNWSSEVRAALSSLGTTTTESTLLTKPNVGEVLDTWLHHYNSFWDHYQANTGGYQDPSVPNRPVRTYAQCFLPPQPTLHTDHHPPPSYLKQDTNHSLIRFRLGSHHLGVTLGRYSTPRQDYAARICTRCTMHRVDNEHHMIFDCPALEQYRQPHPAAAFALHSVRSFSTMGHVQRQFLSDAMNILSIRFFMMTPRGPVDLRFL